MKKYKNVITKDSVCTITSTIYDYNMDNEEQVMHMYVKRWKTCQQTAS